MTHEELKRLVDAYAEAAESSACAEEQGGPGDAEWWYAELERCKEAAHKAIDALDLAASVKV